MERREGGRRKVGVEGGEGGRKERRRGRKE